MNRLRTLSILLLFVSLLFVSCKKKTNQADESVVFRTITLKEEHRLNDKDKNPLLSIELKYQYPLAYSDDSVLRKIRKIMLAEFIPEVSDTATQPEAALKSCMQSKIKFYETNCANLKEEEGPEVGEGGLWKDHTRLLIRCNGNGLLSYTIESSQFTGGAHGGMWFKNSILDLKTGEKLEEEDLFTEASLPLINDMVLKKLEIQNNVESPDELEQIGYFDVSQIGQYKNFYLTDSNLVYTFNEGEIGAYALGTIEVKLSYQDLESFVAPGSPLEKTIRK